MVSKRDRSKMESEAAEIAIHQDADVEEEGTLNSKRVKYTNDDSWPDTEGFSARRRLFRDDARDFSPKDTTEPFPELDLNYHPSTIVATDKLSPHEPVSPSISSLTANSAKDKEPIRPLIEVPKSYGVICSPSPSEFFVNQEMGSDQANTTNTSAWNEREENLFLLLINDYGRNFERIADHLPARDVDDVSSRSSSSPLQLTNLQTRH